MSNPRNLANVGRKRRGRPPGGPSQSSGQPRNVWDALDVIKRDTKQGLRRLTNIVNAELKHSSVDFTSQAIDADAATIQEVVEIAQGDDSDDRDGRSILIDTLHARLTVVKHASATTTLTRVVLFYCHGASLPTAVTDLLQVDNVASIKSYALDSIAKWKIFHDELVITSVAHPAQLVAFDMPWHKHITYNGTGANNGQIGRVGILLMSSEATNTPAVTGNVVARFYDN